MTFHERNDQGSEQSHAARDGLNAKRHDIEIGIYSVIT